MKKRLLAILLTVCMVLSMAPAALAAGSVFTDVNADDWFVDEVEYVYDNGLMNGVGDNKFDPDGDVTRAMMWTTLARMDGVNTNGSDPWWLIGQQWAMEEEISDGTMAENNITREQMVTMLWRYAKYIDMDVSVGEDTNILSYTDAFNVNEWAISAMQWACGAGIINGIDGALQPQGYATRAQLAAILYRFAEEVANAAPATHTVTFMWNYGDKGVYETVEVEDGQTVGSLRNPSRAGYDFSGWYTEDGVRFSLSTVVTEDIVVYAKWSKDVYIPSHTHSWTAGTPVPPTCSSEGYTPYTCSCGVGKNDDFVPAVEHVAGEKCPHCGVTEVETAEQLLAAAQGEGEVKIKMIANITIDIAAWQNNALGGEGTTSVIIDGENGDVDYTLTFNQTNSDWNNVVTNNEATLVLKNMNITNSGHNDGPWNRHDINFGCNVEMENVNSDKALAFKAGATLTNVTIADANTSDIYAIWIQPNGQTVTLDGCTIDMLAATDGRGIKIDEQYVDTPAKVTLNVSKTTFKTEEKSAILVKSKAGADITLSEVDISGVVADSVNEVWVDSASAAYQEFVIVTGGNKILEGAVAKIGDMYYSTLQKAVDAAVDGDAVTLLENITEDVTVTQKPDVKFTIDGANKELAGVIVVDGKSGTYLTAGLTIKNVVFKADSISEDACINLGDGTNATRYTCNVTVEGCTFDVPDAVGVKSYTGGDKNLTITDCTVTANGHSLVQAKGIDGVKVEKCKVYSKNGMNFNNSDNVIVTECEADVKGYAVRFGESSGGAGAAETYKIEKSTLKSACDDGDAVIILRGTADYATLNVNETSITGSVEIKNTATDAKVYIDGVLQKAAATQDDLNSAVSGSNTEVEVDLAAGSYTMPTTSGDVTISGTKDTVISGNTCTADKVTFNGVTIQSTGAAYTGIQHSDEVVYNNVTIKGNMYLYAKKVVFNNCTFDLSETNDYIWVYGATNVEFNNCTFNTMGKAILVFQDGSAVDQTVKVEGCIFNATESKTTWNGIHIAAVSIDGSQGGTYNVILNGNTVDADFNGLWQDKTSAGNISVTVDGATALAPNS